MDSLITLLEQNWKIALGTLVVSVPVVWVVFHFVYRERIANLKEWISRKDDEIRALKEKVQVGGARSGNGLQELEQKWKDRVLDIAPQLASDYVTIRDALLYVKDESEYSTTMLGTAVDVFTKIASALRQAAKDGRIEVRGERQFAMVMQQKQLIISPESWESFNFELDACLDAQAGGKAQATAPDSPYGWTNLLVNKGQLLREFPRKRE
jgi:hypothetical protein